MRAATASAVDDDRLRARFAGALDALGFSSKTDVALAVSGGGDSIALMRLYAAWARNTAAKPPYVLVVDHGLRPDSDREARLVVEWAEAEGLRASVLAAPAEAAAPRAPVEADIENWARKLRYRLMGAWCRANRVGALFLAHTLDDQAETFLMRLGRGSGVDGLSGMRVCAPFPLPGFEVMLYRPLLAVGRAELRAFLVRSGVPWLEDPMNADPRFARTRIRALLPALEAAGVPAARVALAARHLGRARDALEHETARFLAAHVHFDPEGFATLDGTGLLGTQPEIGLRALSAVLMRVSGRGYRPRFERLERLLAGLLEGETGARTLHGCRIGLAPKSGARFGPSTLLVRPEPPRRSRKAQPIEPLPGRAGNSPQKGRNRPI